jgi:hypothetical protein
LNFYGYVDGDPVNLIDWTGLVPGKGYKTLLEAADAGTLWIHDNATLPQRLRGELGVALYWGGPGLFYHSEIEESSIQSPSHIDLRDVDMCYDWRPEQPPPGIYFLVGNVHTHPPIPGYDRFIFSGSDHAWPLAGNWVWAIPVGYNGDFLKRIGLVPKAPLWPRPLEEELPGP